jgi:hypothetical protein
MSVCMCVGWMRKEKEGKVAAINNTLNYDIIFMKGRN